MGRELSSSVQPTHVHPDRFFSSIHIIRSLNCNNARGQLNFLIREPDYLAIWDFCDTYIIMDDVARVLVGLKRNGKKVGERDLSSSMQSTYVHPDCFFSSIHMVLTSNRSNESMGNWISSSSRGGLLCYWSRANWIFAKPIYYAWCGTCTVGLKLNGS